jgi:hypothetical protein
MSDKRRCAGIVMVKSFTNLLRPEFGQPTYAASYGSNLAHAAWG